MGKSQKFVFPVACPEVPTWNDSTTKGKNDLVWHVCRCVDASTKVGMFGANWDALIDGGEAVALDGDFSSHRSMDEKLRCFDFHGRFATRWGVDDNNMKNTSDVFAFAWNVDQFVATN